MPKPTRTATPAPAVVPAEQPALHVNGQGPATSEPVIHLARLVVEIDGKSEQLNRLAQGIEPLRPLRLTPVEGESTLYDKLAALLRQARALVQQLAEAGDAIGIETTIRQLDDLLNDVQWELLPETINRLADKKRQQDELLQQYKSQVETHRLAYNRLKQALDHAARVRAPVRPYAEQLRRLESRLGQADRTLVNFEQPFTFLVEAVQALTAESTQLDQSLDTIGKIVTDTERIVRNADLLLIQAPLDLYNRYQYEVGLRVTGNPSHSRVYPRLHFWRCRT
jgi:chromosome segregation ATPase